MKLTPALVAKLAARWSARIVRRRIRPHAVVLMYHRVADLIVDPWNIAVSPRHFAGHMQALSEIAEVVPLEALPEIVRGGVRSTPVAALTFDDAYLDSLTAAKPVLDSLNVPATVFVPTGWIDDPRPMWWDRLAHVMFTAPEVPGRMDLHVGGVDFSWQMPDVARAGPAGRKARAQLHRSIWVRLRTLPNDDARHEVVNALVAALRTDETSVADARPLSAAELRTLAACGRVSIGSHAVTHPSLPGLSREAKAWEIGHSAEQCEQLTGRRPSTFAYPFGDLDDESVELVRDAGYSLACSTREDLYWDGDDVFVLPRVAVGNWSPREFRQRMSWYWLV